MSRAPILAWTMLAVLITPVQAADTPAADQFSREQIEQQLQKAQERLDQAAHEVADLGMKLGNQFAFDMEPWMRHKSPRAVLGINIGTPVPGAPRVTDGVPIVSVSPGGPADIAGLKANDVILSFGGKELRSQEGHSPQQVLSALMFDAKAVEPITVEYRRDGKLERTQVVPKIFPIFLSGSFDHGFEGFGQKLHELNPAMRQRDLTGFGSAELLDLSPALGKYFGTDKGLLVVHAPSDGRLKLQDGDVILDIDGRVPNSGSHALQILSSYRAGEKLKIHIMRQQKHVELLIEISNDPKMSWVVP
jgi:S1-C subfamily serine protease